MEKPCIPVSRSYQSNCPVNIPTVPPTPAPKGVSDIQSDAKDRFAGMIWIQKEPSRSVEDYFVDYDYWEAYSETKSYSKRTYQAAYKGTMREYHNYLCILNSEQGDEYYVIAKRVRSELEQLEPYCTCSRCISSFLNPLKYLWCHNCTRCIKAGPGFANPEYVIKAKELKELAEKRKIIPSRYGKYIHGTRWIKVVELFIILLIIIVVFSFAS